MGCGGAKNAVAEQNLVPPTLAYWDWHGRGDPPRMLLHHLGIKYEDKQYKFNDEAVSGWGSQKSKLGMVFPNLPYWQEEGDICHSETISVLRSICRRYNPLYMGRNQTEQAYADSFTNTIYSEFMGWFGPYMFAADWASKKTEAKAPAHKFLKTVENCIGSKKYVAANDVTYADFIAFWALRIMKMYDSSLISSFKLNEYMHNFSNLSGIAAAQKAQARLPWFLPHCAWQNDRAKAEANVVGMNAFFEIESGSEAYFKEIASQAIAQSQNESGTQDYNFCYDGQKVMTREIYKNANAALAHINALDSHMKKMGEFARLYDLQVSGLSSEIDKLARPLRQALGGVVEFLTVEAGHHYASNDASAIGMNSFYEINPGDEAAFNSLRDKLAALTAKEAGSMDYNFTYNGHRVMVREQYSSVDAVLEHMGAIDPILQEITKFSKLTNMIITGSATELAQLRTPFEGMLGSVPEFRAIEGGFHKP